MLMRPKLSRIIASAGACSPPCKLRVPVPSGKTVTTSGEAEDMIAFRTCANIDEFEEGDVLLVTAVEEVMRDSPSL